MANFTKQKRIPFIGEFRQLFGGAMTWMTMMTFIFSGLAAWNTPTMAQIRQAIPWLNMGTFIGIIAFVLLVAMFVEHKYIQPSIMVYWNKMHYEQGNPQMRRQKALEDIILTYVIKDEHDRDEAKKILDECDQ